MTTEQEIKQLAFEKELKWVAFAGKLIEALRPLAEIAIQSNYKVYDDDWILLVGDGSITVGDCRRAKELIEEWERNY